MPSGTPSIPDTTTRSLDASPLRSRSYARTLRFVGVGDVQHAAVRRKRNSVRPARGLRDQLHGAFRRNVIHAVEIQLAAIGLIAERRIGEVDVPVAAHHDVVRRVQPLAFPLVGQHLDFALLVGARHAARAGLAGVKPALASKALPFGPLRVSRGRRRSCSPGTHFRSRSPGVSLKSR